MLERQISEVLPFLRLHPCSISILILLIFGEKFKFQTYFATLYRALESTFAKGKVKVTFVICMKTICCNLLKSTKKENKFEITPLIPIQNPYNAKSFKFLQKHYFKKSSIDVNLFGGLRGYYDIQTIELYRLLILCNVKEEFSKMFTARSISYEVHLKAQYECLSYNIFIHIDLYVIAEYQKLKNTKRCNPCMFDYPISDNCLICTFIWIFAFGYLSELRLETELLYSLLQRMLLKKPINMKICQSSLSNPMTAYFFQPKLRVEFFNNHEETNKISGSVSIATKLKAINKPQ
ncbi:hypothetical protein AGLY_004934 [Aphis glycines]|uniref:Uncharacterized protein n=1 Tax=Aphis glycines TaxID=307491 RepID=A0A6G0TVC9_APHGL|nr:hypothetical protein AGLY_004934 [Aphis glycines]